MSDLPPPLPGEIDREGEPPRDPIGDIQEWVRSYQEAPPHPPDETTMHVGSRTVPETWYLAAVAERDEARAEAHEWLHQMIATALKLGSLQAEEAKVRALAVRLRDVLGQFYDRAGVLDEDAENLLDDPEVQALDAVATTGKEDTP